MSRRYKVRVGSDCRQSFLPIRGGLYMEGWIVSVLLRRSPEMTAGVLIGNKSMIEKAEWSKHSARWRLQLASALQAVKDWEKATSLVEQCLKWGNGTAQQEILQDPSPAFCFVSLGATWRVHWQHYEDACWQQRSADLLCTESKL